MHRHPTAFLVPALIGSMLSSLGAVATAQEEPAKEMPVQQAPAEPHFVVIRYPEDKDQAIAMVGGTTLTLGDLVKHIDERHYPGFAKRMETELGFKRFLQSDLIAAWVRHFADIRALEQATADRDIDPKALDETISARLKSDFEAYLARYLEDRKNSGQTAKLSQERVNRLLTQFQLRRGLSIELQGWLDHLVPKDYEYPQLRDFYARDPRIFGGQVTIAHILIQHRDAGTGILLKPKGRAQAEARIAEVRLRLEPDGSNFADVARLMSEDSRTSNDGGTIPGIYRFDERLPPELCRAAWALEDGQMSDVVESRYGYHFLYRREFEQKIYMIPKGEEAMARIKVVLRRSQQENLLFEARGKTGLELKL